MCIAARADDFIARYPNLADSREAHAFVEASRRQLLDGQPHRCLDGKPDKTSGVQAVIAIQRTAHEGRLPAPHHHRIRRK
jgi:hypothetical protein